MCVPPEGSARLSAIKQMIKFILIQNEGSEIIFSVLHWTGLENYELEGFLAIKSYGKTVISPRQEMLDHPVLMVFNWEQC
jgi:hypothetical protein